MLVETDFEVDVLDPARPDAALVTSAGELIRYSGRVDMLAVDAHDAYWIVRHRVVDGDWPPTEQLVADEESLAACWAWEHFYIGMAIAGTIYNELRSPSEASREAPRPGRRPRRWPWLRPRLKATLPAVRQHEPSGGGRSIPQHRRMYAQAREPKRVKPLEQLETDGFRRTWLRRDPADVRQAGRRLGADVAEMTREDLDIYPEPADDKCPTCPYPRPLPSAHERPRRRPHPPDELPQAPARTPGGRAPRRTRLEPGPRCRPAEVPAAPATDIQGGGNSDQEATWTTRTKSTRW